MLYIFFLTFALMVIFKYIFIFYIYILHIQIGTEHTLKKVVDEGTVDMLVNLLQSDNPYLVGYASITLAYLAKRGMLADVICFRRSLPYMLYVLYYFSTYFLLFAFYFSSFRFSRFPILLDCTVCLLRYHFYRSRS